MNPASTFVHNPEFIATYIIGSIADFLFLHCKSTGPIVFIPHNWWGVFGLNLNSWQNKNREQKCAVVYNTVTNMVPAQES